MTDLLEIADRVQIEALRAEFSDAVMTNDHERFATLFTPDGALRIPAARLEAVGAVQLQALGKRREAQMELFVQTTHAGAIQIDGDTATGRAYIAERMRTHGGESHVNHGTYHDRYQRTRTGWKFVERVYELSYLASTPAETHPTTTDTKDQP